MTGRILILGATGRLGRIAATTFRDAGWQVVSQVRPGAAGRAASDTEIVEVNLRDYSAVREAASGADVVLNALSPTLLEWTGLVPFFTDVSITAAASAGATLLFPGNTYNFGAAMPKVLDEATPMRPTTRKGVQRADAEEQMRDATTEGLPRLIILRCGDFFGAGSGAWFDRVIVRHLVQRRMIYPGPLNVVHPWAYLPDVAATFLRLAEARDAFGPFARLGFPGHAITGEQLSRTLAQVIQRNVKVERMPWTMLRLLSPVVPTFRDLTEMSYLWKMPHRIDGVDLQAAIGTIPHTPLETALAQALVDLGFDL